MTGDDVLANISCSLSGTPSADVLGTVTFTNGASANSPITLAASAFVLDGLYSNFRNPNFTGNVTLNNGAAVYSGHGYTPYITGNVTVNDTSRFADAVVTGSVTFNDNSVNDSYYTWSTTGSCTFNDNSHTGGASVTLTDDCTFNNSSYHAASGTITGNCTFNDSSYNAGAITGNVTLKGSSYNNGTITGNCTFNDSSYGASGNTIIGSAIVRQSATAFVTWRNYATSTYVSTLSLKFPEMDILGTGLL